MRAPHCSVGSRQVRSIILLEGEDKSVLVAESMVALLGDSLLSESKEPTSGELQSCIDPRALVAWLEPLRADKAIAGVIWLA